MLGVEVRVGVRSRVRVRGRVMGSVGSGSGPGSGSGLYGHAMAEANGHRVKFLRHPGGD